MRGLILLLLLGCTPDAQQERQARLCGHLVSMDETVVKLRRLQNSADAALAAWNQTDWQQAEQQTENAFTAAKATAAEVEGVDFAELEAAYGQLDQAVQNLPQQLNDSNQRRQIISYSASIAFVRPLHSASQYQ